MDAFGICMPIVGRVEFHVAMLNIGGRNSPAMFFETKNI
jgi:hypothetical protein